MHNNKQTYSFAYFIAYIFVYETGRQQILDRMAEGIPFQLCKTALERVCCVSLARSNYRAKRLSAS